MLRSYFTLVGGLALAAGMASPSYAGMSQDLSSCTAAKDPGAAAACTRIMNSGRLPREQMWIGYFNRGTANRHSGRYAMAVADFTQVLALNPGYARAYQSRGMAQDDLGARDKALIDLDKAIDVDPKDWSAFYSRAVVMRANGDSEPALRDLDTAANLNNKMPQIPLMRALILADKGSYDAARAEINEVISGGRGDAAANYARAAVAFDEKRFDAAEADLDRALELRANFAAAHALMGRILEERGDKAAAKVRYDKALAAPPDFFDSRTARQVARERLALVGGKSDASQNAADKGSDDKETISKSDAIEGDSDLAAKDTADVADAALPRPERPIDCRVFLPASGVTVSSKCSE